MDRVVADASVVIKFFVDEEHSPQARSLLDSHIKGVIEIMTPSILAYEVLNGLRYSKNKYSLNEVKTVAKALCDYGFTSFDSAGELAMKTIDLVFEHRITVYDASYIALAEVSDSKLYTADRRLIDAVGLPFIKHIKDFK
jgi:predicted nucleic acid-binding protein